MNIQTPSSMMLGTKISDLTRALLVLCLFGLPSSLCFGYTGIISSYVNVTADGTSTWYGLEDLGATTVDFEGHFLGAFDLETDTLSLTGGQINTYKGDGGDVTGGDLFYRVYPASGTAPAFSNLSMIFGSNAPVTDAGGNTFGGSGDQRWEQSAAINLLSGLENGDYIFETFSRASTNEEDRYQSNSGNNYKATFTAVPEPSAFLFGGVVCSVLGICQQRRQRRSRG